MFRFVVRLPTVSPQHRTIFSAFSIPSPPAPNEKQKYHERKILPYQQSQLYDIVADVDEYHRFVPFCTSSHVLKRSKGNIETKVTKLQAELKVGFLRFEEKYISDVECKPHEMVQAVASTEVPLFKSLVTTWRFQPASASSPHPTSNIMSTLQQPVDAKDGPTLVTFDLEYAFANPVHAHISAAFFGQVSKMMISAFEGRCLEVYGPGVR